MKRIALALTGLPLLVIFALPGNAQDVTVNDITPSLLLNDNQDDDCSNGWDWAILTDGGIAPSDTNNTFEITSVSEPEGPCGEPVPIVHIDYNGLRGLQSSENSLQIDANGDMRFVNDRIFFDRSASRIGIGTDTPGASLGISALNPEIRLQDTTDNVAMSIEFNAGELRIEGDDGQNVVRIQETAPATSLFIADNGDIGLGTGAPEAPLHVSSVKGDARLLVRETNAATVSRELFALENNGPPRFVFQNTATADAWNFQMLDAGHLRFLATGDQGRVIMYRSGRMSVGTSSGNHFNLAPNGNLEIGGTLTTNSDIHAKQDIEALSSNDVLDKIGQLAVTEWSYKDAPNERHIGPMAQDFHAAFGLGAKSTSIAPMDAAGVALKGIQALNGEISDLKAENTRLRDEIAALRTLVESSLR